MVKMQARPSRACNATSAQDAICNCRHQRTRIHVQRSFAPNGIATIPKTLKAITARWIARMTWLRSEVVVAVTPSEVHGESQTPQRADAFLTPRRRRELDCEAGFVDMQFRSMGSI